MAKYTITLDGEAARDFEAIVKSTHLKGPSDVFRAALNVFNVMLESERDGRVVFMRDLERRFWLYSPHRSVQDETVLRQVTPAEVLGTGNVPVDPPGKIEKPGVGTKVFDMAG